jgi:serine/threonine protein kinase
VPTHEIPRTYLQPGDMFASRYQVECLLGEGDRKCTYLAWDTRMKRQVALAVVKPEALHLDPEGTAREAEVLGLIGRHAYVVTLHDMSLDGPQQYMVFDYLSGGTLAEALATAMKNGEPIPLERILRFGRQLCRALSHLHKRGIVHRDLSPGNVWLDDRGEAHLGDFDSAVLINHPDDGKRPVTTLSCASPEEKTGGKLDNRSDLFSLGAVLGCIATGGDFAADAALIRSMRPDLPSSFADLVADLVAPLPEDRPGEVDIVLTRLSAIGHASNVEDIIACGEGPQVEFKASLRHPYKALPPNLPAVQENAWRQKMKKELGKEVTKTIAGFLNSEGGTLVIGVHDNGTVLGIEADFATFKAGEQDADSWQQALKQLIVNAFGADVLAVVTISLVALRDQTLAVVACPRRLVETWLLESPEEFYVRAASSTEPLSPPKAARYIREHWPL